MISKELEITFNLAVREAERRRHELVCIEHILFAMLQDPFACNILQNVGVDLEKLRGGLESYLSALNAVPEGKDFRIEQTVAVTRVLRRAAIHVQSSGKKEIDAGDVLAAMYREPESHAVFLLKQQGVTRLDILDFISHGVSKMAGGPTGPEESPFARPGDEDEEGGQKRQDPLSAFTENLNQRARDGKLDPLVGREEEMQRTLHVLCRRRKNNPVFVGEPGVGKTAIAEGLAQLIERGEVPEIVLGTEIFALDMGALIAGTKFRGEFEARLKAVIKEIMADPKRVLFIDEIHTIIGAGAVSGGTLDASNILKPGLNNGELRCMGSTTFKEYKNIFEKDRALARRFQKVDIREPTVEETVKILKGLRKHYEEYHSVTFTNSALQAAAELSHKYINERFLPDKAIDVIDEAGAGARLMPESKRPKSIRAKDIERVVAKIARIPSQTVSTSDRDKLTSLERDLKLVIYGQDTAVTDLVSAIKLSRSGLGDPQKPVGSFLFSGPTGVGKTELARQLARVLGVELIRFDMSEYMEKHTVSRLIGAPPGYVGFDQGGLLTDAIIKNPHAVLILDEIEKAHPDIFNILLQVMDHATLTDNNGRKADFRSIVLIMTTNAGAFLMEQGAIGFTDTLRSDSGKEVIEKMFPPEFRNRLDAWIAFNHLTHEVVEQIVDKMVAELEEQLTAKRVALTLADGARQWLAKNGYDRKFGARPMRRMIDRELRRRLADEILFGALADGGAVEVDASSDGKELVLRVEAKPSKNEPTAEAVSDPDAAETEDVDS